MKGELSSRNLADNLQQKSEALPQQKMKYKALVKKAQTTVYLTRLQGTVKHRVQLFQGARASMSSRRASMIEAHLEPSSFYTTAGVLGAWKASMDRGVPR